MKKKLNVLFAAYEAVPFIKTGGLGDVAGSLPAALNGEEVDIRVVLPKLAQIPEKYVKEMQYLGNFNVPLGWRNCYCGLFELRYNGVIWYFLDNEYYFDRQMPYGYYDDGERMAFFAKAICECCAYLPDFFPDVLHCNDWHTALAPVFLREQYRDAPGYADIRTVFTIHNLKFQGQYDPGMLGDVLGLHDCQAARDQLIWGGALNYLAGACSYVDRITTVSPTYAQEICTGEFGEKMENLFLRRRDVLSGILNGIDTAAYDPAADKNIPENYTDIAGKAANKAALQRELGLPENPDVPLLVAVSRLTEQKGFDLVDAVLGEILDTGAQVAILGTGDKRFEDHYNWLAPARPDQFAAAIRFSEPLSRRFYAGGDIFLMPSRFEPCGLSQMIAMRYGTLPIVRQTGGLMDSVYPYNKFTGEGTGFGFRNFNAHEFLDTVRAACDLYYNDRPAFEKLQKNAMAEKFDWNASATQYLALYRSMFA